MRCSGITRGGERCKLDATHGSYCWSHTPETAAARRHRAGKGGRAGGTVAPRVPPGRSRQEPFAPSLDGWPRTWKAVGWTGAPRRS